MSTKEIGWCYLLDLSVAFYVQIKLYSDELTNFPLSVA